VVTGLALLILSLTVHEFAHAWSAFRLGDDTAARQGRMTLNPVPHIDPFGTLLLPALMLWQGGFLFGWANPVPVNPSRFRRGVSQGAGMAITAGAGPLANIVLAVLATVGLGIYYRFSDGSASPAPVLLSRVVLLNVGLALFNLIPIPPLDGSRIVDWLIPYRLRPQWEVVERFAPFLLIGVFIYGGRLISGPYRVVVDLLESLLHAIA
jgi:Zn-dependent protease